MNPIDFLFLVFNKLFSLGGNRIKKYFSSVVGYIWMIKILNKWDLMFMELQQLI